MEGACGVFKFKAHSNFLRKDTRRSFGYLFSFFLVLYELGLTLDECAKWDPRMQETQGGDDFGKETNQYS